MNAEFIAMLDYLERERGIKREILIEAVSQLCFPHQRKASAPRAISGSTSTRAPATSVRCNLCDEVTNAQDELSLTKARRI